jgi:large subunit ribosomal protein L13
MEEMMKTFMAKPASVERKWYIIDAKNVPLGRLATQIADILSGKNKPTYTPHVDSGDHVVVINSDYIVLTGKKLEQKKLYSYSGYVGGLKETLYKTLMIENSPKAVLKAVKGMLPKNTLGKKMITRLRVFKNEEHTHLAQQPIEVAAKGVK